MKKYFVILFTLLFSSLSFAGDCDGLARGVENLAKKVASIKGRVKAAELPTKGKIRFVPDKKYRASNDLPTGIMNGKRGFKDRFGNIWTKGPSRTKGQDFEWDVQLSRQGKAQLGHLSRDGNKAHLNVSLDGRITH